MRGFLFGPVLALGALLTISACGGGGGGVAASGDGGDPPFELDYAGVTGSGIHDDPYVLPSVNQDGVAQGIEDYLKNSGDSVWTVTVDGMVQSTVFATAEISGELVYETRTETWLVNIDGTDRAYTGHGTAHYFHCEVGNPYTTCGSFDPWYFTDEKTGEDYLESKYGTFARLDFDDPDDGIRNGSFIAYFHFGLKTPTESMPTSGTGSYDGFFRGHVGYQDSSETWGSVINGEAEVSVNFGTGDVSFFSTREDTSPTSGYAYSISGDATINGNTYEGTMSASYEGVDGNSLTITSDNGTMSGAFYGPAAEETAGVVYGISGDGELAGGFWATAQ